MWRVVKRAFQSGEDRLLVGWSKHDEGFVEALEGFGGAGREVGFGGGGGHSRIHKTNRLEAVLIP